MWNVFYVTGAFLIPYFIMLTFVGIPVFFIELAVGQYSGSGPATVWEAAPLFRGKQTKTQIQIQRKLMHLTLEGDQCTVKSVRAVTLT